MVTTALWGYYISYAELFVVAEYNFEFILLKPRDLFHICKKENLRVSQTLTFLVFFFFFLNLKEKRKEEVLEEG